MNNWVNGKRVKPRESHCKHCDLYPCKRSECDRKLLIENNRLKMVSSTVCETWDYKMKRFLQTDYIYRLREF